MAFIIYIKPYKGYQKLPKTTISCKRNYITENAGFYLWRHKKSTSPGMFKKYETAFDSPAPLCNEFPFSGDVEFVERSLRVNWAKQEIDWLIRQLKQVHNNLWNFSHIFYDCLVQMIMSVGSDIYVRFQIAILYSVRRLFYLCWIPTCLINPTCYIVVLGDVCWAAVL